MWAPCASFAYRGESFDFPAYEIDDMMNVRRGGRVLARSGAWNVQLAGSQFDVRRLRLAVHRPLPLHIERDCGLRRNRAFPLDDARAYEYETPADRAIATNDARRSTTPGDIAVPGPRPWAAVRYPDRERDFVLQTFASYEMHRITGKVRRVATRAPISATRNNTMHLEFDGKRVMVSWHVAYMCTFRWSCRFEDQTEINRIDGDATNNSVSNLRWASRTENCLYQWRRKAPRHAVVPFSGDASTLREFSGFFFGPDGTVVNPQGNVRTFKVHRTAPYPVVVIEGERYRVHRIVAHLFLGLTLRELTAPVTSDRVVMHVNDIKTDYRVSNLRIGTQSENMRGVKRPRLAPQESSSVASSGPEAPRSPARGRRREEKGGRFVTEEIDALVELVNKHGTGAWAVIRAEGRGRGFAMTRTQVDLKDKWRNLLKAGHPAATAAQERSVGRIAKKRFAA